MSDELHRLAEVMGRFADTEVRGSSPLYEQLAHAAAEDPDLLSLLLTAPRAQRRGTLFFAAIHSLLLAGAGGALARFYPDLTEEPVGGDPAPSLRAFCLEHAVELQELYATRNTQTNEVARTSFLLPMFGLVAARAHKPLAMIEAGASAGLNLLFDRYFYDYGAAGSVGDPASPLHLKPEVRGPVPVPPAMPAIASRASIDVKPVDLYDDDAIAWLRACIWPEHADRVEQLARAVQIARNDPPSVARGNVLELLPRAIRDAPAEAAVCLFHRSTLAYLDRDERMRFKEIVTEAGSTRDVFWVAGEGPRIVSALFPDAGVEAHPDGYALVVAHAGGDARWVGSAGYHGRWLEWAETRA
jgi:hypothetical protein